MPYHKRDGTFVLLVLTPREWLSRLRWRFTRSNGERGDENLLDDKRPLAEFLDEHCGWVLVNLVEAKADTVGEWCDIITELAPWQTETECRAFLDRVRPKFAETSIFEVYRDDEGKWDIKIFDSRYSHWHTIWLHCREHGSEFEEARKAFLRGELEEFLVSKGSIEAAAV